MTLAKYAKNKGYTLEGFIALENGIKAAAEVVLEQIKNNYPTDSGMYYPTSEVLADGELYPFIIAELKALGVEFLDNCQLFRY